MQVLSMPGLDFFLADCGDDGAYPWRGTFDDMRNKTFVVLHTSGSTGIPKPVFVTHGTFAGNDAHQLITSLGGNPTTVDYLKGKRFFLAFPLFHAANLTFTIGFNVYSGITCVLPPPEPLTVDIVNMVHTFGNLHGSLLPPSMIIDIYNNSEYLVNMTRRLHFVAYVGGKLPEEIGDQISSRLKLITLMGSTETMLLPIELNSSFTDWQYLPISPFLGHEFRLSRDGLHELVIVRNANLDLFQGVFSTFPNLEEYPMSDLYEQHPKKPGSWVFQARADDIIAFNNAEKLNPVTMEAIISAHPAVNAAIIGGQGEFQAALLVEPKVSPTTSEEKAQLLHDIWPTVVQANRDCPAHGRIMKDFIIFTSPDKPMPRAGKGTVQRYATLKLYAHEFEAFYASSKPSTQAQNGTLNGKIKLPSVVSEESKPLTSVSELVAQDVAANLSADGGTGRSSVPNHAATYAASELDARIEATLHRVLPGLLLEHLGPAVAQMMASLRNSVMLQSKTVNLTNGIAISTSDRANGTQLSTVPRPHAPEGQGSGKTVYPQSIPVNQGPAASPTKSDGNGPEDLRGSLHRLIANNTYLHGFNDTINLFDCGLDSLQVPVLVDEINAYLIKSRANVGLISNKTIYDNPSVEKLQAALEVSSGAPMDSSVVMVDGTEQM